MYTALLRDLGVAASQFAAGPVDDKSFLESKEDDTDETVGDEFYTEASRVRIIENPVYCANRPAAESIATTRFHCVNICQYIRFRNFNEFDDVAQPSPANAGETESGVRVSPSSMLHEHAAQRILAFLESASSRRAAPSLTHRELSLAVMVADALYSSVQQLSTQYGMLYLSDTQAGGGPRREQSHRNKRHDALLTKIDVVCCGGESSIALDIDVSRHLGLFGLGSELTSRAAQRSVTRMAHVVDEPDIPGESGVDEHRNDLKDALGPFHQRFNSACGLPRTDPSLVALRRRVHISALRLILSQVATNVLNRCKSIMSTAWKASILHNSRELTGSPSTGLREVLRGWFMQKKQSVANNRVHTSSGSRGDLRRALCACLSTRVRVYEEDATVPEGVCEALDAVVAQVEQLTRHPSVVMSGDTQEASLQLLSSAAPFSTSISLHATLFAAAPKRSLIPASLCHLAHRQSMPEETTSTSYKKRYAKALAERERMIMHRGLTTATTQPRDERAKHRSEANPSLLAAVSSTKAPEQHYFPPAFFRRVTDTESVPIRNVVLLATWSIQDSDVDDGSERGLLDVLHRAPPSPNSVGRTSFDLVLVAGPLGHAHHALLDGHWRHQRGRQHEPGSDDEEECGGVVVLGSTGRGLLDRCAATMLPEPPSPYGWVNADGRVLDLRIPHFSADRRGRLPDDGDITMIDLSLPSVCRGHHLLNLTVVSPNAGFDVLDAGILTNEQVASEEKKARLLPSMLIAISPAGGTEKSDTPLGIPSMFDCCGSNDDDRDASLLPLAVWMTASSELRLSVKKQCFWDTVTVLERELKWAASSESSGEGPREKATVVMPGDDDCGLIHQGGSWAGSHNDNNSTTTPAATLQDSNGYHFEVEMARSIAKGVWDRIGPAVRYLARNAYHARHEALMKATSLGLNIAHTLLVDVSVHR